MKFLHYAALIATTSAVRLRSTADVKDLQDLVEVNKHIPSPEEVWDHFDKNGDNKWSLKEAL